jgi:6,7-dimethyl-8-ribityllumazine synthase
MELRATDERYAGYIALGCAIRGETDHYDNICRETMGGLQRLVLEYSLAVGTGILTVHNRQQAMERCVPERRNHGGQAARACLRMIELKRELSLIPK